MSKYCYLLRVKWYTHSVVKIGAHVSAAVSLALSIDRAKHIGAECIQIFISPPQQWIQPDINSEQLSLFTEKHTSSQISPIFIHATYLINLASIKTNHYLKSVNWLINSQKIASSTKLSGTILHLGSHKGLGFEKVFNQVITAIQQILNETAQSTSLILENCAGGGGQIGCSFEELGRIIKAIKDPRLKVCLDTQHAFAYGYDLRSSENIKETLEKFNQQIGLEKLAVVHCNDSKTDLGSKTDRHENIGKGFIGKEGFQSLLNILNNDLTLKNLPLILEVPGFGNAGPDKENLSVLKSIRENFNTPS